MNRYYFALFLKITIIILGITFFLSSTLLFLPVILFFALVTLFVHCPKCDKNVFVNPINLFGIKFWAFTVKIPKKCSKCGCYMYKKDCIIEMEDEVERNTLEKSKKEPINLINILKLGKDD